MVGKLQSNKAKNAINLFDYIHSLDTQKLLIFFQIVKKIMEKKLIILFK